MLDQQLSEKDIVYQELTQVLAETEEILEEKEEVIQALKLRAQESRQDETEAILAMEQALKDSEHQKEELARQLEEAETVIGLLQQDMAVNREPSVTDKEINESFTVAMVRISFFSRNFLNELFFQEAVATVSEGIQAEFEPNTVPQPVGIYLCF